jgi:hypothetical protein
MYRAGSKHHRWEFQGMARNGDFEKMSYADLTKMQADIERAMVTLRSAKIGPKLRRL